MANFKSLRSVGVALAALAVASVAAVAAGMFPGLPIVGAGSYCGGFSTGVNGQVCTVTVPAGPTALTGKELIPADTQLAQGQAPQTVSIPAAALGAGLQQVVTTNASVAMVQGQTSLISNQTTATIALINLPPNPVNGQRATITNAGSGVLTITSIAVASGSGQSIVQGAAPASLAIQTNNSAAAAASTVQYVYNAANTTWYRVL